MGGSERLQGGYSLTLAPGWWTNRHSDREADRQCVCVLRGREEERRARSGNSTSNSRVAGNDRAQSRARGSSAEDRKRLD